MAHSRGWLLVWLVSFLASGELIAAITTTNVGVTSSVSSAAGTVTLATEAGGVLRWTYTKPANSGSTVYGLWLYRTTANGGAYGSVVFDINPAGAATASGTLSPASGQWFLLGARVLDQSTGNGTDTIGYYQFGSASNKVTIRLFNPRDVPVTYKLMQNGTEVGSVVLQPRTGVIQTFTLPSSASVQVFELVPGLNRDGDAWVLVDGATHSSPVGEITPQSVPTGDPDPEPVTVDADPDVPTAVTPNPVPDSKPVWVSNTTNNNPAAQVDLLTNATFREGIDKLYQLKKKEQERQDKALDANPAQSVMSAQGSSASSSVRSLYGTVPTAPTFSSGSQPTLSVTLPAAFGGATFDMNPFTNDRFAAICAWFRAACAWLAIVHLGAYVWKELAEWTRALAQVRQAQGNAVVGGTGAQATALVAASAITVAVVACVTALLAWSFGELSVAAIRTVTSQNPLVTLPLGAYWMLNQVLPVATIVTCALARVTFNMYAAPLFAGCSAVVRFVVP